MYVDTFLYNPLIRLMIIHVQVNAGQPLSGEVDERLAYLGNPLLPWHSQGISVEFFK